MDGFSRYLLHYLSFDVILGTPGAAHALVNDLDLIMVRAVDSENSANYLFGMGTRFFCCNCKEMVKLRKTDLIMWNRLI